MTFSVVMPIHNEEAMLRQTLNSVYALDPDEMIFCLDRCTDGTEQLIRESTEDRGLGGRVRLLKFSEDSCAGWRFRAAYMRRLAYAKAENPTIVNTSADLNLDPAIRDIIGQIPDPYALISFGYYDRWTIQTFLIRIQQTVKRNGFGGLHLRPGHQHADRGGPHSHKRHIPQRGVGVQRHSVP